MAIGGMLLAPTLSGYVWAAPTTVVRGQGTEGTFTCADGTEETAAGFFFFVTREKGNTATFKLSGSGAVFSTDGLGRSIQMNVYGGNVGKSFSLLSIEESHDNICVSDPVPAKGTITGQCGQGVPVQVQFNFENGAHGTFKGNVVCY